MPRFLATLILVLAASTTVQADDYALTVYSTAGPGAVSPERYRPVPGQPLPEFGANLPGYAVIRQDRAVTLKEGRSELRYNDVAALIDPTTVTFKSLTDPDGTRVLEQNYQFDLVSADKLLQRYVGKTITVEQALGDGVERITGKLLGAHGGLILQREDGRVVTLQSYSNVLYPELPGGLITEPTLVWLVDAEQGGRHETRVSYQTKGMTWWTDYNAIYSEAQGCSLDLSAWVSLINQSGASYPDAKLKLVAGDVHRAEPSVRPMYESMRVRAAVAKDQGFKEKALFEYHLYTLQRPTNLPDNSTKQIRLFPTAFDVPCEKKFVYEGAPSYGYYGGVQTHAGFGQTGNTDVKVFLRFKNNQASGLGMPLPAGRIRVNLQDPEDGSLEFIGEDAIDHTPKDEPVLIEMGNAFDLVGEREQTDFYVDKDADVMRESFKIVLRNHKDEDVNIIVREHLYRWSNWEILNASHEFEKQNSRTIHFPVNVPANGETTLTYTVKYDW